MIIKPVLHPYANAVYPVDGPEPQPYIYIYFTIIIIINMFEVFAECVCITHCDQLQQIST